MKALIIIACVIVYLVMWVVTGIIGYRENWTETTEVSAGFGFCWWITLPFVCVSKLIYKIDEWLDRRERIKELEEEAQ